MIVDQIHRARRPTGDEVERIIREERPVCGFTRWSPHPEFLREGARDQRFQAARLLHRHRASRI